MSEKDPFDHSKHSHTEVVPLATKQRNDGTLDVLVQTIGEEDRATHDAAALAFAEAIGGKLNDGFATPDEVREAEIELEAARDGKAAFFSSNRWRAPWEPTGPRAPWGHSNDATEGKPN